VFRLLNRLGLDLCHHDPIPPFVRERIGLSKKSGLISLIGFVDLSNGISGSIFHLRTSSGSIPRNQSEREHGPIIVLEMARVRQNGASP